VTTLTKFPGTLTRYQAQIIDVLARALPDKELEVYLFGSRARGDEQEGSDADLAIIGGLTAAIFQSFVNNGNIPLFL
jgi:predicted nucleotidyltransferase